MNVCDLNDILGPSIVIGAYLAYLEHHTGLAVGEAGHHQAGAVAERHVVGELEGLEVLGLARGLRHAHFLHIVSI